MRYKLLLLQQSPWAFAGVVAGLTALTCVAVALLVTSTMPVPKSLFRANLLILGLIPLMVTLPVLRIIAGHMLRSDRARELAEQLATLDPLTGVCNRRRFFALAETELARAQRSERPSAVLLFDIDQFKCINDLFGHTIGDEVLKNVAKVCQSQLRPYDVLARFGGDEFAILLPDTEAAAAMAIAERLRASVAEAALVGGGHTITGPTISVGVTSLYVQESGLGGLLTLADRAMYVAKRAGRNQVRFAAAGQ